MNHYFLQYCEATYLALSTVQHFYTINWIPHCWKRGTGADYFEGPNSLTRPRTNLNNNLLPSNVDLLFLRDAVQQLGQRSHMIKLQVIIFYHPWRGQG